MRALSGTSVFFFLSVAGAHILSGNVFEPRALNELIPDWKEQNVSLVCKASVSFSLLLLSNC
jgi:electron-transferring-flavoprotein dehydrogenase